MGYADLGGLGSKLGEPVIYNWAAPSMVPAFLPWLAILALLALKSNRCGAAWWIWVPLLCVGGMNLLPQSALDLLPTNQMEVFLEWVGALGFGVAAVWLLAGGLAWKHRALTFLAILGAQEAFSLLTSACQHGLDAEGVGLAVPLALASAMLSVGLSLAGRLCRGRYGWLRLSLWALAMMAAVWAVIILPFFVVMILSMTLGRSVPLNVMIVYEVLAVTVTFGALLPFLVLAFVNSFYRERLKGLLHLGAAPAAPPVTPPPAPAVETAAV